MTILYHTRKTIKHRAAMASVTAGVSDVPFGFTHKHSEIYRKGAPLTPATRLARHFTCLKQSKAISDNIMGNVMETAIYDAAIYAGISKERILLHHRATSIFKETGEIDLLVKPHEIGVGGTYWSINSKLSLRERGVQAAHVGRCFKDEIIREEKLICPAKWEDRYKFDIARNVVFTWLENSKANPKNYLTVEKQIKSMKLKQENPDYYFVDLFLTVLDIERMDLLFREMVKGENVL